MAGRREVPARSFAAAVSAATGAKCWWEPLWAVRRWYPWFLWPAWALALLLSAGSPAGSRRRWLVGAGLLLLSLALVLFEAAYLRQEYVPFLSGLPGRVEVAAAWLVVGAILLWRRRRDRRVGALEATLAGQGLLGAAHALTLPTTVARPWWGAHSPGRVLASLWIDFPTAFWMGLAALLLVSLPVYLRKPPNPLLGRPQVDS